MKKTSIDTKVIEKFNELLENEMPAAQHSRITNSGTPGTSWMQQVTDKIKISDLACRAGIDKCPECKKYSVNFDDGRGWFCCQGWPGCRFGGNIVDFCVKTGVEL